jgi:hypothetical protein
VTQTNPISHLLRGVDKATVTPPVLSQGRRFPAGGRWATGRAGPLARFEPPLGRHLGGGRYESAVPIA